MTELRRGRWLVAIACGTVLLAGAGTGGWWLLGASADEPGCERLLEDKRLRQALGERYEEGLDCGGLGRELRAVTSGDGEGNGHGATRAQARAMRLMLTAISDSMPEGRSPALTVDPALREPVTVALTSYTPDVAEILGGSNSDHTRHHGPSGETWKDGDGVHMAVSRDVLVRVLRALSDSPDAFSALRGASVDAFTADMDGVARGAGADAVRGPARKGARVLGTFEAIRTDVIRDGHDADDPAQEQTADQKVSEASADPANQISSYVDEWAQKQGLDTGGASLGMLQRDVRNDQSAAATESERVLGSEE